MVATQEQTTASTNKHKQRTTKNFTKSRTTSGNPAWGWVTTTASTNKPSFVVKFSSYGGPGQSTYLSYLLKVQWFGL